MRGAAFLDRDGTIIVDRDYPGDPEAVELLPGAAASIVRLRTAGWPVLVITNQSGIGRGLISEADFQAVQRRMEELLEAEGAAVDGIYHCPHAPHDTHPCECRKPGPALYLTAAAEHGIDLAASCFVGDRMRDVVPGERFGGAGFLIRGTEQVDAAALPRDVRMVDSLAEATELWLSRGV